MRVLLTAGPTREPLDPVRYLSNRSTGTMGFALAGALRARGHVPLLVLGPTERQPPVGVDVFAVETAAEMLEAVLDLLPGADAAICAAAVSDYRPATRAAEKIKRGDGSVHLELVPNPDIAAEIGARRDGRPLAVFALESGDGVANATRKVRAKNADVCVLNGPEAIGAERARFRLVFADGTVTDLGALDKPALAAALLDALGIGEAAR